MIGNVNRDSSIAVVCGGLSISDVCGGLSFSEDVDRSV
jgi:hypothetical protein